MNILKRFISLNVLGPKSLLRVIEFLFTYKTTRKFNRYNIIWDLVSKDKQNSLFFCVSIYTNQHNIYTFFLFIRNLMLCFKPEVPYFLTVSASQFLTSSRLLEI